MCAGRVRSAPSEAVVLSRNELFTTDLDQLRINWIRCSLGLVLRKVRYSNFVARALIEVSHLNKHFTYGIPTAR